MIESLFANDHVVVVDKPAGWLSVPSRQGAEDVRPCVGKELEAGLGIRLWPVHRLDLEVTGLLLFAKSADAHRQANRWFEERLVRKTYEALTTGEEPAKGAQEWRSVLLRGKKRAYESPHGKHAETTATFLSSQVVAGEQALHWELQPHTGRPHQLRFELARHGFPILGDKLYGSTRAFGGSLDESRIALRCVRLNFAQCPGAEQIGLPVELLTHGIFDPDAKPRARDLAPQPPSA